MEVGHFQPYLVTHLPGGELGHDPFLHFLLGYHVGGLGVISSGGEISESFFQIG